MMPPSAPGPTLPNYMHESPRTSSASTDEVSQVTCLARWAWTLRTQHNAKRRVARVCGKWRTSAALDGWSWAGHRVHHVVWVVQGIEHATSGGSGGGVKRKELMDSSMTMERRAGSDWNKYGTRIPLLGTRDQGEKSKSRNRLLPT
ncbi:hypothetical protein C8J57DRAFT_1240545 [Mycena rebaudengoi]|nr:hypothetical protein C8J57DRAFT_1240545 [Mycena rebaudengoi]